MTPTPNAFDAGHAAGVYGQRITANPHAAHTLRWREWCRGWSVGWCYKRANDADDRHMAEEEAYENRRGAYGGGERLTRRQLI